MVSQALIFSNQEYGLNSTTFIRKSFLELDLVSCHKNLTFHFPLI